jgi:hypothetical protein
MRVVEVPSEPAVGTIADDLRKLESQHRHRHRQFVNELRAARRRPRGAGRFGARRGGGVSGRR